MVFDIFKFFKEYSIIVLLSKDELRRIGRSLGFEEVRVCSTEPFEDHGHRLRERISEGLYPQELVEWEAALQRRPGEFDPTSIEPDARSIVALAYHYYTDAPTDLTRPGDPHGVLARAYMMDVYGELSRKRDALAGELRRRGVQVTATDRLPLKSMAVRAGVGWQGEHSLVVNRGLGSWITLGCLLLDTELEPDDPQESGCGGCTACMAACPTGAIKAPGVIDANRCIDYLTCKTGLVSHDLRERMGNRIVSCDRCQEACPYNRKSKATRKAIPELDPRYRVSPALIPLLRTREEEFARHYADCDLIDNSPVSFRRNVVTALGNLGDPVALTELEGLEADDPVVSETCEWAIERIRSRRA
jgi:epoxyqueuosine reductase